MKNAENFNRSSSIEKILSSSSNPINNLILPLPISGVYFSKDEQSIDQRYVSWAPVHSSRLFVVEGMMNA